MEKKSAPRPKDSGTPWDEGKRPFDLAEIIGVGTAEAAERAPPPKIYHFDVRDEDERGGHTVREHVGKSDAYLLRRMRQEQIKLRIGPTALVNITPRIGSFASVASANALTSPTLA